MKGQGVKYFVVGVGNVRDASIRKRLFQIGIDSGLEPLTVVHPTASRSNWARIGRGAQLLPGCIVNAGAEVGENAIVNSGAIVEHDCVVGSHAHVATGARLASAVRVGDGSLIGVGASVRQGIKIGRSAVVGAGAVVVDDVPDDVIVAGVPARILRILGTARKWPDRGPYSRSGGSCEVELDDPSGCATPCE
jgi:sugar O-acyltransferase (sialic acid O-acetyltransferase NeuD family)